MLCLKLFTVQRLVWLRIGYVKESDKLYKALDICTVSEKKLVMTGRDTGATSEQFADYIMETIAGLD